LRQRFISFQSLPALYTARSANPALSPLNAGANRFWLAKGASFMNSLSGTGTTELTHLTNLIKVTRAGITCAMVALGGCVVAPYEVQPAYAAGSAYVAPAGVVYVAPTYAIPAPGYAWRYHGRFGWGWRHPHHGWHRGWR
jgi:hypothetical protein